MVPKDNNIVHADSLLGHNSLRFKDNNFSMPELHDINQAAYWDYQREKIYVKSNARLKQTSRKNASRGPKTFLPVNKTLVCPVPDCCPKCETTRIYKRVKLSKVVYDLKFGCTSVKRWIVRYLFHRYFCDHCGTTFFSSQRPWTGEKYGTNVLAYTIYQIIDLQLPQITVTKSLNQLFNLR